MTQAQARTVFENKVTTGNVIALFGPVLVIVGGLVAMQSSLTKHDEQISDLRAKVDATRADHDLLIRIDTKLAGVLDQLARQRAAAEKGASALQ